jgi:hypothetical protein
LQNKSGAQPFAPRFFFLPAILANNFRNGRSKISPRPENHIHELVAIVVVIIPIAIGMPAVAVFVPPTMPLVPAALAGLMQFMPCAICLSTIPTVMLHGFVQSVVRLGDTAGGPPWRYGGWSALAIRRVVRLGDTALATMVVIRKRTRRSGEGQHASKQCSGEHRLSKKPIPSRLKLHVLSILPYAPWLEWGQVLGYKTPKRRECSMR